MSGRWFEMRQCVPIQHRVVVEMIAFKSRAIRPIQVLQQLVPPAFSRKRIGFQTRRAQYAQGSQKRSGERGGLLRKVIIIHTAHGTGNHFVQPEQIRISGKGRISLCDEQRARVLFGQTARRLDLQVHPRMPHSRKPHRQIVPYAHRGDDQDFALNRMRVAKRLQLCEVIVHEKNPFANC